MKIGILGAGSVGGTLGKGWAAAGHQVLFGVRDPSADKVQTLLEEAGKRACAGSLEEAVGFGEAVLLAVPWDAVEEVLAKVGDFGGKVLMDATNPLDENLDLTLGHSTSGGERVAELATDARVVKAFCTTGFGNMADPSYPDGAVTDFHCGDDEDAKATVRRLATDLGFDSVDAGPLAMARDLEPLAHLWIRLAMGGLGRDIAYRLMRR